MSGTWIKEDARRPTTTAAAMSVLVALALLGSTPAEAQTEGWQFQLTPYLWAAGISGEMGVGKLAVSGVEASPSDLFKHLDLGVMGAFEARKGLWGFVVDGMYLHLSDSAPTPEAGFGEANVDMTQQLYTAAATYRVIQGETPVDLVGGARYNYIKLDLELTSGAVAGRSAGRTEDWWDGFVGARVERQFAEKWSVAGYADIGTGGSEFTWQAIANGGYHFSKTISGNLGYRILGVDREEGDFLYDMTTGGFFAAVGIKW